MLNRMQYIRELQGLLPRLTAKKIFRKIKNKAIDGVAEIFSNVFGTEMSDSEFLREVWNSEYGFEDSKKLARHFFNREKPKFFFDALHEDKITSLLSKCFADILDKTIIEANEVCEHKFALFGPEKVNLGTEIDWHCDFRAGYCWNPKKYYKDIRTPYEKADVKVPWELSRFQHLSILGEAYWLTSDERYTREFVNQIIDWMDKNKPKFGVNWACTMDVSIRACNWILGYYFFKDSKESNDDFLLKLLKSLYQHGRHIMANLERSKTLTTNHYLSDIVGLVYIGMMFPEFKDAQKWREFGIKELIKEMEKQVYPDGCNFEASTCYHRLVLELFFFPTLLVVINDSEFNGKNHREITEKVFGKDYTERLYGMFEFVLYALKPNGKMPQIGDNDNGRLHIFTNREVLDMQYLLTFGAILFKEPKFKVKEFGFCEEALWIFGEEGYKIWQNLEENSLANIGSRAFPDAGWYIMRNDKDYMIISCGPNGQNGNGGHCHNDKLSFELCIDGEDIIVDPGTYVYTSHPEWRNKFRSTAYHNTVVVDDKEQDRFNEKNLFWMRNEAKVKVNKWETNEVYDFLETQHFGYERLSEPINHRRQILFNKKESYWVIKDILTGKGKHTFDLYFHFAPMKLEIEKEDPLVANSNIAGGRNIVIVPMETKGLKVSIQEGWVSYSYGEKVTALVIRYSRTTRTPVQFVTVIYPFKAFVPLIENIREIATAFLKSREITFLSVK